MEIINTLLNDLDLTKLVPELDKLTGWLQLLLQIAANVGPITLLVMGIIYVVLPPSEATHKAGLRTYFGMGSIQAWRFSQLVGGAAIALLGLVLTIISRINAAAYPAMPMMEAGLAAIELIKGQIISTAIVYALLFLAMAVLFDRSGKCRFAIKLPFVPENLTEPVPEEEEIPEEAAEEAENHMPEFYQEESTAPLRVEDIVIEGLEEEESVF